MNVGSSYALGCARRFAIYLLIGTLFIVPISNLLLAGTRPSHTGEKWRILDGDVDLRLLRNQPHYVAEGMGAAGMLLGESETDLLKRYGPPAYRNYAQPETLIYTELVFNADFVLRNGRIVKISLDVAKKKSPSLEWLTALGLREAMLEKMSPEKAAQYLSRFYRTSRVRFSETSVEVMARGIRFDFFRNRIIRVVVTEPALYGEAGE